MLPPDFIHKYVIGRIIIPLLLRERCIFKSLRSLFLFFCDEKRKSEPKKKNTLYYSAAAQRMVKWM